jgi:hypothetical protein
MKLIFIIVTVLSFICSYASAYSSSGRNPPRKLSERQVKVLEKFIPLIPKEEDIFEIVAIAMVETNLSPKAVSHTGDYGVLQVNCRVHEKRLRKLFGFKDCKKDMLVMEKNVTASMFILSRFRRYRWCRGSKVYSCYNGGQGWRVVMKKCLETCEGKRCKSCNRPERYGKSVKKHIRFLKKKYKDLITRLSATSQRSVKTRTMNEPNRR